MFSLVHVHDRRGVMKKFSKKVPKHARKFYFLVQPLYYITNLFLLSLSLKERIGAQNFSHYNMILLRISSNRMFLLIWFPAKVYSKYYCYFWCVCTRKMINSVPKLHDSFKTRWHAREIICFLFSSSIVTFNLVRCNKTSLYEIVAITLSSNYIKKTWFVSNPDIPYFQSSDYSLRNTYRKSISIHYINVLFHRCTEVVKRDFPIYICV